MCVDVSLWIIRALSLEELLSKQINIRAEADHFSEIWEGFALKWKRLIINDVPVKYVHFVHRHGFLEEKRKNSNYDNAITNHKLTHQIGHNDLFIQEMPRSI